MPLHHTTESMFSFSPCTSKEYKGERETYIGTVHGWGSDHMNCSPKQDSGCNLTCVHACMDYGVALASGPRPRKKAGQLPFTVGGVSCHLWTCLRGLFTMMNKAAKQLYVCGCGTALCFACTLQSSPRPSLCKI